MTYGKPVIGVIGGICSGKSFVARQFAELGCCVIDSDRLVHEEYAQDDVKIELVNWWGPKVLTADGALNRKAVAAIVFESPDEKRRLEKYIHPRIARRRDRIMVEHANDERVPAYVWDAPLLLEAGMRHLCDAVVFVECPLEERTARAKTRGWDENELKRRENRQMPLDKKQLEADYVIDNSHTSSRVGQHVSDVLTRIVNNTLG